MYANEGEEDTLSTSDKEEEKMEECLNVRNGLLNIYECGKNVFQSTYKR